MVNKVNIFTCIMNRRLQNFKQVNGVIKNLKQQGFKKLYQKAYKVEDVLGNRTKDCVIISASNKADGINTIAVINGDNFIAQKLSRTKFIPLNGKEYTAEKVYTNASGMKLKEGFEIRTSNEGQPAVHSSYMNDLLNKIKTIVSRIGDERVTTVSDGAIKKVSNYTYWNKKVVDKFYLHGKECTREMAELAGLV